MIRAVVLLPFRFFKWLIILGVVCFAISMFAVALEGVGSDKPQTCDAMQANNMIAHDCLAPDGNIILKTDKNGQFINPANR